MDPQATVRDTLVPLLGGLIRNRCVNDGTPDSGHEMRSVETLREFFSSYGLSGEVFAKLPERGNLLVRIPGTDPAVPKLMFMGHLDVVPARESEWSFDPFAGDLADGYVRGRGAVDMLNMTASMAVAVAECAAAGERYPGDLIFLAVADEESSGRYGAGWLVSEHWDAVKTEYMVTELGGFFLETHRGQGITVTVGEKGLGWTKLSVRGTAGHGSMPFLADNAALKAGEAAVRLARHRTLGRPAPEYLRMADEFARSVPERFLLKRRRTMDRALERLYRDNAGLAKFLHTASRTTISPNVITAGTKVNIIADHGELLLDIRTLPGTTKDELAAELKSALGELADEFEIDVFGYFPSNVSPVETPLMEATAVLARGQYPDAHLVPMFIGGVTDGRYWRSRGTTVYGFSLFAPEMTMSEYTRMLHGRDEKISVASLGRSFSYFRNLPREFFSRLG